MRIEPSSLLRLEKSNVQPATEVLARAFQNYPLVKYYYADPAKRISISRNFCAVGAYFGVRYGEVYATSPNLEGVAIWLRSENYPMNFGNILRSVPLPVLIGFGMSGGIRMKSAGLYVDNVHKRLAPYKHWYLSVLGVDPQFQGKGYSSRLVRPMLKRFDQEKLPCYLETNDETDVEIYLHFGFKVIEEGIIPDTTIKNWAMLREVGASNDDNRG